MAKLILKQNEENPEESQASCVFAYFEGTPTSKEVRDAGGWADELTEPYPCDNEVSKRAGLQRWLLAQSV